jgi:hypothetical protein
MTTKNIRSRALKVAACLLIQVSLPFGFVYAAGKQLTQAQAEELLLNMPNVIAAKEKQGCPKAHLLWQYERKASLVFELRDSCSKWGPEASDLMGIYAVDAKRAEVCQGIEPLRDRSNIIDSPRLQELRRQYFGLKRK